MNNIHYLVFSGGGAAVYGHAGAILELTKQPDFSLSQIKAVAGASVGTLAALLIGLNYSAERIFEIMKTFDLTKLADGGILPMRVHRLFSEYGMHKGDELYKLILQLLKEKTGRSDPENITFKDLQRSGFKDLYVIATKIYQENGKALAKEKVFSPDNTPDTSVAAAILASCSAPGYFRRVRLKKAGKGKYILDENGDLYDDGGIVNNYPIDIFDQPQFIPNTELKEMKKIINPHTLGFALLNNAQINDNNHPVVKTILPDYRPITYSMSLVNALTLQFQKSRLEKRHNRLRTVQIDRMNTGLAEFGIDEHNKLALFLSGKQAVIDYLAFNKQAKTRVINDTTFAEKNVSVGQLWGTTSKERRQPNLEEEIERLTLSNII